ncbi:MAG: hypothetical protein AAB250_18580, partial [Bdellovibrionota bacterium]
MKKRITTALITMAAALNANAKLEAHEWGTFTSLVGSDGVTQTGLYHEDEKLPSFVYGFGETRSPIAAPEPSPDDDCVYTKGGCFSRRRLQPITQKMETPVIYFYSDQSQRIDVRVKFPKGVVTETYPAPIMTSPQTANSALENGDTTFSVDITTAAFQYLPYVEPGNIYSHAREVASQYVTSGNDVEKFIFYRGLGRFQPRVSMTSAGGRLSLSAPAGSVPQAAFLVHVDEVGDGRLMRLTALDSKGSEIVSTRMMERLRTHGPDNAFGRILTGVDSSNALIDSLVTAGLNKDEAVAMVRTWEHGYLKVPGLRLLYVLPRAEVDQILPITMTPSPDKFERVFVGRIEILLDTEEERVLTEVANP